MDLETMIFARSEELFSYHWMTFQISISIMVNPSSAKHLSMFVGLTIQYLSTFFTNALLKLCLKHRSVKSSHIKNHFRMVFFFPSFWFIFFNKQKHCQCRWAICWCFNMQSHPKFKFRANIVNIFFIIICSCLVPPLPKRTFFAIQTFCW